MIQTVVKRDGRIVGFNEQKIMAAIRKAMLHTDKGEDERLLYQITDRIAQRGEDRMTVEQIQDLVELERDARRSGYPRLRLLPGSLRAHELYKRN